MSEHEILKFPYVQYPIADIHGKLIRKVCRPVIPVELFYGSKKFKVDALVDTGADECCFPGEFATLLGHSLMKGKTRNFTGIGGSKIAYLHKTDIKIGRYKLTVNIYYSNDWNNWGFGLLGQSGFLTRFDALFSRRDKELSLIPKL